MNREFLINILLLVVINFLIKPIYVFGIDRTVQNRVDEGIYGVFFTIFSFSYVFSISSDLGIRYFNNRNIAQHRFLLDKYFPNLMILKGWLGLFFMALVLVMGLFTGYTQSYPLFIFLISFNLLLASMVAFLRSNISGLGLYMTDSLISVLDRTLLIIMLSILLFHPFFAADFKIEWFIMTQTMTLSITTLVALWIILRHTKQLKFKLNLPLSILILKKSWPYAVAVFLMTAYSRLDAVMIEQMLPDGFLESDVYATAQRLFEASNTIGYLFAGLLIPMFARQLKQGEQFKELLGFSFQLIMGGALTLAISTYFFQEEIMVLLYVNGSAYSGAILGNLILGFVAVCGVYIYSSLLTANESLKSMNIIFVVGVCLNFTLNALLIPHYKALGAAVATLITQFFIFFGLLWLSKKVLKLEVPWKIVGRIVVAIILLIGSNLILKRILPISWPLQFLVSLISGIGISMAIGLIDVFSFLDLLKKRKPSTGFK